MGNLLRRVLAFVLGMVFTLAAAGGALVGGAYWAYKNVKPVGIITKPGSGLDDLNKPLGDLNEQSIEDLLGLLNGALENPDEFTFARLESEYGIDFNALLKKAGIENVDTESKDWAALMGISLFNLKDGIEPFLDNIKVRAFYNFLPAIVKKDLDQILSREAQEKLGDYSIMELIRSDEVTQQTGIVKAIKTLKIGSLLPTFFKAEYDEVKHEYTYVLNEEEEAAQKLPVLDIFGNVSLGVVESLVNGGDFMTELMEGGFSSVTKMPVEDIIDKIIATFSPELAEKVKEHTKAFNGASVSDLFVPNAEGGYDFYYMGVLSGIKTGYLLGLNDDDGDGVWVDKEGKPAQDLIQVVANLNFGTIIEEEDKFEMVRKLIGDLNIGMILDMCGINEGDIVALDAFRGLEVGKLLEGQSGGFDANVFVKALISNLQQSFGDITLGQLIKMENTGNAIVDGIFELKLSDFMLEEYTLENIVEAFRDALGDVSIGDILNYKKDENGQWICDNKVISLILDFSFNNIFDMLESDYSVAQVIETLLPDTTIGDIISMFGYEYDEVKGQYYKKFESGAKNYISKNLSGLLNFKLCDIVTGILEEESPIDVYAELNKVMVGDLIDFVCATADTYFNEFIYRPEENKYIWDGEETSSTTEFLNITLAQLTADAVGGFEEFLTKDVDFYFDILGDVINVVASLADIQQYIPVSTVDNIIGIVKETVDGNFKKLYLNENAQIYEVIVRVAIIAVNGAWPENVRPAWATAIVDILTKHVDEGGFRDLPEGLDNIRMDSVVEDLELLANSFEGPHKEWVPEIAQLLKGVLAGTVLHPGVERNITIKQLADEIIAILDNADNNVTDIISAVISEIGKLYGEVVLGDIKDGTLNLNVDNVITTLGNIITNISEEAGEQAKPYINALIEAFEGTVGSFKVNIEPLWNLIPEDIQPIVLVSVIGVGTVGGTLLYFFANDTLITILDKALGENKLIGELVGETLGYTYDAGSDKYYARGNVNQFVDELFHKTIQEVLTTGYDFKGDFEKESATVSNFTDFAYTAFDKLYTNHEDKVYKTVERVLYHLTNMYNNVHVKAFVEGSKNIKIDNILNFVKDVVNVYINNDIANTALDELAKIYKDVKVVDFVEYSKTIDVDTVTAYVVDVVVAILPENKEVVEKAGKLVEDLFAGVLAKPGIESQISVGALVRDLYEVINVYLKDNKIAMVVCRELALLLDNVLVGSFVDDLLAIPVDNVVVSGANIAKEFVNDKADYLTDNLVIAICELVDGTLGAIDIQSDGSVEEVIYAVKNVANAFYSYKPMRLFFDRVAQLYAGVKVSEFVNYSKTIALDDIADILVYTGALIAPEQKERIEDAGVLVKDIIAGTIAKPGIESNISVGKLLIDTNEFVADFYKHDIINKVVEEFNNLLDEVYVGTFVEDVKAILVDDVTMALLNIATFVLNNRGDEMARAIADIFFDLLDGTLGNIQIKDDEVTVKSIAQNVKVAVQQASSEKVVVDTVNVLCDEVSALYKETKVKDIVETTKALYADDVVATVAKVTETALPQYSANINHVKDLVTYVIAGQIKTIGIESQAEVSVVANKLQVVANDYPANATVNAILAQTETLFAGVSFGNFTDKVLDIDTDAIVDSLQVITDTIPALNNETMHGLYGKLHDFVNGTLREFNPDIEKFWNNLNDTEKIIVGSTVTVVVVGGGTLLYFFANDTLIEIVNMAVGENKQVGELAGEFIGFTKQTDGYADSEGVVNPLADALLTITVQEILTTGFKLSDHVDAQLVTVENIAVIGKTATNKNLPENLAQNIKDVVNATFNAIITLYDDVNVKDIKEATLDLYIKDIVEQLALIAKSALAKEKQKVVDDVKTLILSVFGGTVRQPGYYEDMMTADLIIKTKEIVNNYYSPDAFNFAMEGLAKLYGTSKVLDIAEATKAIRVDDVTTLATDTLGYAIPEKKAVFDSVNTLLVELLAGTLAKPGVESNASVGKLIADVYGIVEGFWQNGIVECAVNEVEKLFNDITIGNFKQGFEAILIDDVTTAVLNVARFALNNQGDILADAVADIFYALLDGKLVKPEINKEVRVARLFEDVKVAICTVQQIDIVEKIFDELSILYGDTKISNFVENTKNLQIDAVLDFVSRVVGSVLPVEVAGVADDVKELLKTVVAGTITKPVVDSEVYVSSVLDDLYLIIENYTTHNVVNVIFDKLHQIYNHVKVVNFVEASKNILVHDVIDLVSNVICEFTAEYASVIDDVTNLVKTVVAGTITKPVIVKEAYISEVLEDLYLIIENYTTHQAVKVAVDEINHLYENVKVVDFVKASKELLVDDILHAVSHILGAVFTEYASIIDDVKALVVTLVDGTIIKPVFNKTALVTEVAEDVKLIAENFTDHEVVVAAETEINKLYNGVTLEKFVEATKVLEVKSVVQSVGNVSKAFLNVKGDEMIDDIVDLVNYVFGGTLTNIGYYGNADIGVIIGKVGDITYYATTNSIVKTAFDSFEELMTGLTIENVKTEIKHLKIDNIINALSKIALEATPDKYDALVTSVTKLLTDSLAGDLSAVGIESNLTFDVVTNDLVDVTKSVTDNKIALTAVKELGGLYGTTYVKDAKETTLAIEVYNVVNALKAIGLEITSDKDDNKVIHTAELIQYVVGGTLSAVKLNGEASVGNAILMAYQIVADFTANAVVKEAFTQVAGVFALVTIGNFKEEVKQIKVDDIINAVAKITMSVTEDKIDNIVEDVAKLAIDVFAGNMVKAGLDGEVTFNTIFDDIKAITANFKQVAVVEAILDQLKVLYGDNKVAEIKDVTLALKMDAVVSSLSAVVQTLTNDKYDQVVANTERLVNDVLDGTVSKPGYNGSVEIAIVIIDVRDIVTAIYAHDLITVTFDEIAKLYGIEALRDIKNATLNISLDKVISGGTAIARVILNDKGDRLAEDVKVLLKEFVDGTISKPAINKDMKIATIVNGTYNIVGYFVEKHYEIVEVVVNEICNMYGNAKIGEIVEATKNIKVDSAIESLENIVSTAYPKIATLADDLRGIAVDLFAGTLAKAGIDNETTVKTIIADVQLLLEEYTSHKVLAVTCERLSAIYGDTRVVNFVKATKEIDVDEAVQLVADMAAAFTDKYAGLIDNVAHLAKDIVNGPIVKPVLNKEVEVNVLLQDTKLILEGYITHNSFAVAINELCALYKGVKAKDVVNATKELTIVSVLDGASNVVKEFMNDKGDVLVDKVNVLAQLFVGGTVANPGYHKNVKLVAAVDALVEVIDMFKFAHKDGVISLINSFKNMYTAEDKLFDFINATKNVPIANVTRFVKEQLERFDGVNKSLERVYTIIETVLPGTIGKPGFTVDKLLDTLTKNEKIVVGVVGAEVAIAMYFGANDMLVKLVNKFVGPDKTWFQLVGERIGYTFDGTNYVKNGEINSLMDKVLPEKVSETLTRSYGIKTKFGPYITLGNLLTVSNRVRNKFESLVPGSALLEKKDYENWTMKNSVTVLMDIALNTSLVEVYENRKDIKSYVYNLFKDVRVADVAVGGIINKLSANAKFASNGFNTKAERQADGTWKFTGVYSKLLSTTLNLTAGEIYHALKGKTTGIKNLAKDITKQLSLGDIVGEFLIMLDNKAVLAGKAGNAYNAIYDEATGKWTSTRKFANIITRVCNINLYDFIKGMKKPKDYLASAEILGGVRVGELLGNGYNVYDEVNGIWKNKDKLVVFEEGIKGIFLKRVYDIKVGDILTNNIHIEDLIDGLYIGDVLGYTSTSEDVGGTVVVTWYDKQNVYTATKAGDSWNISSTTTEQKVEVDAIKATLANISFDDILKGTFDFNKIIGGITVGEIMDYGYEAVDPDKYYNYIKHNNTTTVELDANGFGHRIIDKDAPVDELTTVLASTKVDDLMKENGVTTLMNKIKALKLGYLLQYTNDGTGWVDENGAAVSELMQELANSTIKELAEDPVKVINDIELGTIIKMDATTPRILKLFEHTTVGNFQDKMSKLYVGDLISYTCNNAGENHEHTAACIWYSEEQVYVEDALGNVSTTLTTQKVELNALNSTIAKLPLSQLMSADFDIKDMIKDITFGQFMGYIDDGLGNYFKTKMVGENYVVKMNGEFGKYIPDTTAPVDEMISAVATVKIGDLMTANGMNTIINKLRNVRIGLMMGYTDNGGVWTKGAETLTGVMAAVADKTLDQLDHGGFKTLINEFKLGEVIEITTSHPLILQKLKDVAISELPGRINDLTLGDAIAIGDSSSPIMKKLKDVKITEVQTAINGMYVGEVMGYTKAGSTWTKPDGTALSDMDKILVDYTLDDITKGKLGESGPNGLVDKINKNIKVSSFFTWESTGIFAVFTEEEFNALTLSEFSTKLTEKMNPTTMTVGTLASMGIFEGTKFAEEGTQLGLAVMLGYTGSHSDMTAVRAYVSAQTVKELFKGLFATIPTIPVP